jgi:hypothetical protein
LNELVKERGIAGYERDEKLSQFVVMGSWWLDTCGNCLAITECPEDLKKYKVLTLDEYHSLFKEKSITGSCGVGPVPYDQLCDVCGKGWTIKNHADAKVTTDTVKVTTELFVGETVKDLKEYFVKNKAIQYLFWGDYLKRDNKWLEKKDLKDDLVIKEGDLVYVPTRIFRHHSCVKLQARRICQEHIKNDGKDYHMPNLAGRHECDEYIKAELLMADIPGVLEPHEYSEVPYSYIGYLNGFNFRRAWTYWVVSGPVPLDIAKKLYEDPEGKQSVRVAGHCGCPPPEEWAKTIGDKKYVTTYHIDTLNGLKLLADAVRDIKPIEAILITDYDL